MSALLAILGAVSAMVYPQGFCKATDGDTVRCGQERVRIAEIDAPEMPGHCRKNRVCAPGNPHESRASARSFLAQGQVRVERYSVDHYGRTIGDVVVRGQSLACWQVNKRQAIVQKKWGDYGVLRRGCRR